MDEVYTAVEENNQNTGGSYLEQNSAVLFIRSEGLLKNISEVEMIPLTRGPGIPIF